MWGLEVRRGWTPPSCPRPPESPVLPPHPAVKPLHPEDAGSLLEQAAPGPSEEREQLETAHGCTSHAAMSQHMEILQLLLFQFDRMTLQVWLSFCSTGANPLSGSLLEGWWRTNPPLSSRPFDSPSRCPLLSSSCFSLEVGKSQCPGHIQSALSLPMIISLKHVRMPFLGLQIFGVCP